MSILHILASILLATVIVFFIGIFLPPMTFTQSLVVGGCIGLVSMWLLSRVFE